jgi:hypothetical protein
VSQCAGGAERICTCLLTRWVSVLVELNGFVLAF